MKDYYKIDLEAFMQNNKVLMSEIRSKAPVYADDMGLDEVQYINREIKRAHLDYVENQGVKDPYEYYVSQHEEDRQLAEQLITQHRNALHLHPLIHVISATPLVWQCVVIPVIIETA